jgi:Xaa-Pro aminopeptidase
VRAYRHGRIKQKLAEHDCAALLAYDPLNIRYATDCSDMQIWTMHNASRYALVCTEGPTICFEYAQAQLTRTATLARTDTATQQALDQATEAATVARDAVKDHPIASLAVVGGLAFAIGALWKMQRSPKVSHVDSLMARLSDLQQHLPKRWRA